MQNFPPTPFFDQLIDDFGIWQHTNGASIVRENGYSLASAAKALIFCLNQNKINQCEVLFSYIRNSKTQVGFSGFAKEDRSYVDTPATGEVLGQVIWCSGYSISKSYHINEMAQLVVDVSVELDKTQSMVGYAYGLLGAVYISRDLAEHYYSKLHAFFENVDEFWPWPDPILGANGGVVAYAFLRYGLISNNQDSVNIGQKILDFLEERCTYERQRGPIGTDGWLNRGASQVPLFSQIPSEAAGMIWAWIASYQSSANHNFKDHAGFWMNWFEGENIIRAKMYNPEDLRCYDSIEEWGINYNSSSESNTCFLLSKVMLDQTITI